MDEALPDVVDAPWAATILISGETRERALDMLRTLMLAMELPGATGTICLANEGAEVKVEVCTSRVRV